MRASILSAPPTGERTRGFPAMRRAYTPLHDCAMPMAYKSKPDRDGNTLTSLENRSHVHSTMHAKALRPNSRQEDPP